ncbi:predicted protein [Uncinocarpus reesii 1704]|uniref:Protein kinase domain-containing protein n=1 Tax=Uncinocarpus reesii (strain UAMH 1704) TaxID=336963 RepID=C4JHN3_UNCRE|nr:uncharacterized protein UREG_02719 [Uncinocarpus reesii 1704]EEP77870.1 predicted protein [Uncinocarpus reesii 1704]
MYLSSDQRGYYEKPPPLPYTNGQKFAVRAHQPPPPVRKRTDDCLMDREAREERVKLSPLKRCVLHPPWEGSTGNATVEFEISRQIHTGEKRGVQVVAVNILRTSPGCPQSLQNVTTVVAKFYDPLYFDHYDDGVDPFRCVNKFYTTEAASYSRLADLQGTVIPTFYGSYSVEFPVGQSSRYVRLILMELIPGSSMRDLDPKDFTQEERKRIMKLLIDGESAIYHRDVRLTDLHPRNALVVWDRNLRERIRRVVHIDFESNWMSRLWCLDNPELEQRCLPGTFITPLLRWNVAWDQHANFKDWIDWDYQAWLENVFAHTETSITPEMRAEFLPEDQLEYYREYGHSFSWTGKENNPQTP